MVYCDHLIEAQGVSESKCAIDTEQPPIRAWLAQTKFSPPLLPGDLIARPALRAALNAAICAHPLTLVSAPAGYGKTTLLADFCFSISDCLGPTPRDFRLEQTGNDQNRNRYSTIGNRVTWLSLDEEDNNPAHFLACLITALGRVLPDCGDAAHALLSSIPNPASDARRIITAWINDIVAANPDPFVLILDDLHVATEPTVYVALNYLLERAPPSIRLVIGTRHDPPLAGAGPTGRVTHG